MSKSMKHIVGFSGGIDSQACARWVLNRFPKEDVILLNTDAGGNEHPLTTEFIAWYTANIHPVIKVDALIKDLWKTEEFAETKGLNGNDVLTFGNLIKIKGRPPSKIHQFCTTFLKLNPAKRWIEENITGDYCRYSGVRREESEDRKNAEFVGWDNWFDCDLYQPLADWTKKMCFDYVEHHGEQFNPLYKLGFGRVGCAPCINSGKDDIRNWAMRFPEMIDKIRNWEKESGRTFFAPKVPGLRTNNVDQVVEWSMTERGGRQFSLAVLHQPEACSSKYGLCE